MPVNWEVSGGWVGCVGGGGGGGLLVEVFDANVDVFHSVFLCPLLILWSHHGVHQLA
jgi:hypothetical protein